MRACDLVHLTCYLVLLAFCPTQRGLYMYAGVSTLQSRELLIHVTFFPLASFLGQKSIVTCTHSILPVSVNQIFPWTEYIGRLLCLQARSLEMYYELHVGTYMYLPSLLIRV
jgi:hypothetical protein